MFSTHNFVRHLSTQINGVLSGIKVLDLTRILAGPFCTMLLGDLGAEVIKIEKPGVGDDTRRWGPPFITKDLSCYYVSTNRNKKSVAIDLKKPRGRQLLLDLAKNSDILIENYIPGKLTELGIDYDNVKQVNPKIIYASITGFGSSGPYAQRAGIDFIANSIGGLNAITGPEDGDPCRPGIAIADLTTGLYTKGAILSALIHREKTGKGCKIDTNLLSSQVSILSTVASNYLNAGLIPRRRGTAHESIVPYQAFKCKDSKYVTIGAINEPMFQKLCQLIDLPEVSTDPKFASNAKRVENRVLLIGLIQERIQTKELTEWLKVFDNSGFSYGPINDIDDVFRNEQVVHNKCVIDLVTTDGTEIKSLSPAVQYDSENSDILRQQFIAPPLLGEHTREVLKSILNYKDTEIQNLINQKVIQ
ncbi:succinate--hydroxymethylglutarate CoA-transferase-like [Oppia nitens]|uniref:succinate--hydroxymethylglutarate CoA-transferase-like n=1 Tax=Oppia nitens TaxID=1686743 RepID=UPI0023D97C54|nr:succinate--hydroxymethylglutarate CoA-transferase-like [Oppia nitens]